MKAAYITKSKSLIRFHDGLPLAFKKFISHICCLYWWIKFITTIIIIFYPWVYSSQGLKAKKVKIIITIIIIISTNATKFISGHRNASECVLY